MTIKVPCFLMDHPLEGLFAVALLVGLLFSASDGVAPQSSANRLHISEKN
jgi:hypothetical protein